MPVRNPDALIANRLRALRSFHTEVGTNKAQIDVSGGVDSAVMTLLLARALGPQNVVAVHSAIHTNPAQQARAQEVCDVAGVPLVTLDLSAWYDSLVAEMTRLLEEQGQALAAPLDQLDGVDPTILGSIRSTLRAPVGRGFNRLTGGGIRHGTGNECEDRWLRFFQKGGDGEVDTNPLAALAKGEVFQLGLALGVPRSILEARPSPDLWATGDAHNDEDELAAMLGIDPGGHTFYSYVDLATGAYTTVGLIERVSRFADEPAGQALFTQNAPLPELASYAATSPALADLAPPLVAGLLAAARRTERVTRHKANPAIPTLGHRADLLRAGLLTDALPLPAPSLKEAPCAPCSS